jgi:hypothetical protein
MVERHHTHDSLRSLCVPPIRTSFPDRPATGKLIIDLGPPFAGQYPHARPPLLSAVRCHRPAEPPPQRVVVIVNRNREVPGYVVLEENDVIIIRTVDSRIESFPKARILKVVRLVEPKPGQTGVVILRNGQQQEGIVIEDAFDHVLLDIDGIPARLPRKTVDYVILEPTFEERYARYKASLGENQPLRHLELCNWLMSNRKYEMARDELLELLAMEDVPEARHLLKIVEAQLALGPPPRPSESPKDADDDDDPDQPPSAGDESLAGLLTNENVNLIRVYEIDFDRPPKVSVEPETMASSAIPGRAAGDRGADVQAPGP